jgi:DNA primase small subunit
MATTASDIQPMEIDNRYASSAAAARSVESPTATAASTNINNTNNAVVYTPELLQMYYLRLFPFAFVYKWLSYLDASLFKRREFSMTIEPVPGEEIYIRYQSFATETELAAAVRKRRPVKIDIGAVFSSPPKDHKTLQKNSFGPEQRELVFDIDLTDYDEVRHCGCSGAAICPKCWALMTMAVKIMDAGLREDFGFQRVAWFYSGRRGVHAWVCDEGARLLTDEGRSAVASYFEVSYYVFYWCFYWKKCFCLLVGEYELING